MSAKKLLVATVITALLAGCGGNTTQAALPDGTSSDTSMVTPADDSSYGADSGTPTDTGTGSDTSAAPVSDATGTPSTTPSTKGFTLKGLVSDGNGKGVDGASVTIGSQTVLTDASGKYEITGINDTKVYVNITKTGYDAVNQFAVSFSDSQTSVTQDFKLVLKGSNSGSTTPSATGLKHEMTYATTKFKSVSAMVVADNQVYVLGLIDGLLFDSTAVVTFGAADGSIANTFKKIGFLRSLPKDAAYLKVDDDGQLVVSNGETNYTFSLGGEFVKSASGARYSAITEVTDSDRSITYKLNGTTKVNITSKGTTTTYKLEDVGSAKAIGLDSDGHLLVLDSLAKTVQQFSFEQ
jgi:hypothetical protein